MAALVAIAFLPQKVGGRHWMSGNVDRANLQQQHLWQLAYRAKHRRLPVAGGSGFVIAPWQAGVVERTEEDFRRYFTPDAGDSWQAVLERLGGDPAAVWLAGDPVDGRDTDDAGLAAEGRPSDLHTDRVVWMATDNERGQLLPDGSIHVLLGDGNVRRLTLEDFEAYGWTVEDLQSRTRPLPVGPASPMPLLQGLRD